MSTSSLKISIAALSLCVSAVAIYIHLPYVIAAVSGSGAIEAVPLAIFAVSAVVALASVAYLIKLAVSRADNKKKAAPDGEQPTNKLTGVGSNGKLSDTNASKNSSPSSLLPLPPPPLLSSAARKNSANTTDEESPVNAASKSSLPKMPAQHILETSSIYRKIQTKNNADNMLDPRKLDDEKIKAEKLNLKGAASSPPPVMFGTQPNPSPPPPSSPPAPSSSGTLLPKEANSPSMSKARGDMLAQIREGLKLKRIRESSKSEQPQDLSDKLEATLSNDKQETQEEYYARVDRPPEERKKELNYSGIGEVLKKRVKAMALSDSDSENKLSDHGNDWDDEQDEENLAVVPVTNATVQQESQSDLLPEEVKSQQRSESPDSGCGDDVGSRATSPLHPEQKTEESLVPPSSCVDSPSAAQVNNVDPVDNEVQDLSTLSAEDHIAQLCRKPLRYQKESVVRGQ